MTGRNVYLILFGKNLVYYFSMKVLCGIWIALCGTDSVSQLPDFLSVWGDVPRLFT